MNKNIYNNQKSKLCNKKAEQSSTINFFIILSILGKSEESGFHSIGQDNKQEHHPCIKLGNNSIFSFLKYPCIKKCQNPIVQKPWNYSTQTIDHGLLCQ